LSNIFWQLPILKDGIAITDGHSLKTINNRLKGIYVAILYMDDDVF
jgi:hypothetical protein